MSDLRPIEALAMKSLAQKFGGKILIGEDPPDAYLLLNGKDIAVEVSILTQHVVNESGKPIPRLSEDAVAVALCDEIDQEIKKEIPSGIYLSITITTPINKKRQTKVDLIRRIREIAQRREAISEIFRTNGNDIKISLKLGERLSGKKVIGMVFNQNSSSDIMKNVLSILNERIYTKIQKCKNIKHRPLWLALFNDYCLGEPDDYKKAMEKLSLAHSFDKIYLVFEEEVYSLYEA